MQQHPHGGRPDHHSPQPFTLDIAALAALDAEPELRASYEEELKQRLRDAYPERDGTVLMPFRRVFAVARVG